MQVHASPPRTVSTPPAAPTLLRRRDDATRSELLDRYAAHGGLASTTDIVSLMRVYWRQPISMLSHWIVNRKVVSFTCRGEILLPLFQFLRPRMTPHDCVQEVAARLADLMDDEGLGAWFVRPSEWLGHAMPVDLVVADPAAVLGAARRTRERLLASRRTG